MDEIGFSQELISTNIFGTVAKFILRRIIYINPPSQAFGLRKIQAFKEATVQCKNQQIWELAANVQSVFTLINRRSHVSNKQKVRQSKLK